MLRTALTPGFIFLIMMELMASNQVFIDQDSTFSDSLPQVHTKHNLITLPLIYRTPETDWGFGAGLFYAGRFKQYTSETRPSQIQMAFSYTLLDQILLHIPFHYFSNQNKFQVSGEFSYYRFIYEYYGIGANTQLQDLEFFTALYPRLRLQGLATISPAQYVGIRYWMDDFNLISIEEGGLLDRGTVTGANGGLVSALGFVYQIDTRNTIFSTEKGWFFETVSLLNSRWLGSDFQFFKQVLDLRYFKPLNKSSVAFQFYTEIIDGDAPFNQKAMLGGVRRLRGYYEGRFRDNTSLLLQSEWRFPIFWHIHGVLNFAAGVVGPEIWNIDFSYVRPSAGAGLRFVINEKDRIFVRLDYNIGYQSSNYYLTVGEAF